MNTGVKDVGVFGSVTVSFIMGILVYACYGMYTLSYMILLDMYILALLTMYWCICVFIVAIIQ